MKKIILLVVLAFAFYFACGGSSTVNTPRSDDLGFAAGSSSGAILYGYASTQNPTPMRTLGPLGVPMPSSGTLQNLYAVAEPTSIVSGASITVTINGTDSVLSCTFDTQGRCVNSTNQVSVTTGQRVQAILSAPNQLAPYPIVAVVVEKK